MWQREKQGGRREEREQRREEGGERREERGEGRGERGEGRGERGEGREERGASEAQLISSFKGAVKPPLTSSLTSAMSLVTPSQVAATSRKSRSGWSKRPPWRAMAREEKGSRRTR